MSLLNGFVSFFLACFLGGGVATGRLVPGVGGPFLRGGSGLNCLFLDVVGVPFEDFGEGFTGTGLLLALGSFRFEMDEGVVTVLVDGLEVDGVFETMFCCRMLGVFGVVSGSFLGTGEIGLGEEALLPPEIETSITSI